jgi:integrase
MATLFRRNNGVWYVVYRSSGRRRWLSTDTRCFGKALRLFQENLSSWTASRRKSISALADDLVRYSVANNSPATTALYRSSFNTLIEIVGDKPLVLLVRNDAEEFKRVRAEQVSRATVNKEIRTIRAGLALAVEWGAIASNPFRGVRILRVAWKEPGYLSWAEYQRLQTVIADAEFADLVALTVHTMMRRSEIIHLTWDDVDLARGIIHIRNRTDFTPKGMRPRLIPLNRIAWGILSRRVCKAPYVFINSKGRGLVGGTVSRRFKAYVRKAGLSEELHFHSLRHTGASWLVQSGVPIYSVQKILGHSSPTVSQIYSHLDEAHLREAVEKLGANQDMSSIALEDTKRHLN